MKCKTQKQGYGFTGLVVRSLVTRLSGHPDFLLSNKL